MRVAALYDVHGNLPALEAALAEVGEAGADVILSGGDLLLGPQPSECLERLRALGAIFIRGNCDRAVADGAPSDDPWLDRISWVTKQVTESQLEFVRAWPQVVSLKVDGLGAVLFCHGSPRSDEEILTSITPPKRLDPILDGVREGIIVFGHTHVQFERRVGDTLLVNAGSIGLPYEGRAGIACWALVGPEIELRQTPYDVELAVEAISTTGYPDGDGQVRGFLLEPSSAEEATAHFEALASR
jgi:putative phosphoesterase